MHASRSSSEPGTRRISYKKLATFLLLVLLVAVGSLFAWLQEESLDGLSPAAIAEQVEALGLWGHLLIVGLMALHSFVPFPAEFVALAAGMCFGPIIGVATVWVGGMIGACLAFGLARIFGRPFVESLLTPKQSASLDHWSEQRSTRTLLIVRLIPVIAFNLINYAVGLTRVGWWTFCWTTGLGILPLTGAMVYMGHEMRDFSVVELAWSSVLGLAVLLLCALAPKVWRRALGGSSGAR